MHIKVFFVFVFVLKVTVQINKSTDWSQYSGFRHSYIYIYIYIMGKRKIGSWGH